MRIRSRLLFPWFWVCVVLLAFLGCSAADSDSSQGGGKTATTASQPKSHRADGSAFDLCDKLTEADIHEFFPGVTITITHHGDQVFEVLGSRKCFYELSGGDMIFIQISLARTQDMTPALQKQGRTAEGNYQANKKVVDNPVPVKGLGKDAYYGGCGMRAFSGLHVLLDKDTSLSVMVGLGKGNDDDQAHLKVERALAEKIISRL